MCYKTMIGIVSKSEVYNVEVVCRDVAKGDITFMYKIVRPGTPDLLKKFHKILIIISPDLKTANSRGGWFIHSVKNASVSDYFWTKKC